ncbi:MAG: hypothetical protein ABIQ70_09585 [Dokdonella sp.]
MVSDKRGGGFLAVSARLAAIVCAVMFSCTAKAQTPLPNPNLNLRTNGAVYAMAAQVGGALILAGTFDEVDGTPRNNMARLNPDGSLDLTWNPPPNNGASVLTSGPDGSTYVNTTFLGSGGILGTRFAKLTKATGAIDPDWSGTSDFVAAATSDSVDSLYAVSASCDCVRKISMTSGEIDFAFGVSAYHMAAIVRNARGALYIAGHFDNVSGVPRNRIAKVSASGQVIQTWIANLPGSADDAPTALATDLAGNVYVGGPFGVVKLAGSNGASMPQWQNSTANVSTLALAADGSTIFAGGSFTEIGGQSRLNVARLSSQTGLAVPGWNASANSTVSSLLPVSGNKLFIGGQFDHVGDQERTGIAALSAQGIPIAPLVETLSRGQVEAVAAQPNGSVLVGGDFLRADGLPRRNILRLLADGTLDKEWNPSLPFKVERIAIHDDTMLYASGWDPAVLRHSIVARVAHGGVDAGWIAYVDSWLNSLAVDGTGRVYVGGAFSTINNIAKRWIARLSPSNGDPDTWGATANSTVAAIAFGPANEIYAGGFFTQIGGQSRQGIARLSPVSGAADINWNPDINVNGYVSALAINALGDLYAGGQFGRIGG